MILIGLNGILIKIMRINLSWKKILNSYNIFFFSYQAVTVDAAGSCYKCLNCNQKEPSKDPIESCKPEEPFVWF